MITVISGVVLRRNKKMRRMRNYWKPGGMVPLLVQVARFDPRLENALHLFDVLVGDALATPVAALEGVQKEFPHRFCRLQPLRPFAAALELPFEAPDAGESLGTEKATLAAFRVLVCPLDLDGHFRSRSTNAC